MWVSTFPVNEGFYSCFGECLPNIRGIYWNCFFFRERTERIKQKLLVNKTKELPKSKNESDKEEEFEEYEFGKERKEALKRKA